MKRLVLFFTFIACHFLCFSQTWNLETKLVASDREEDEGFGHAVAMTHDLAVITAIYEDEDENGENSIGGAGAAYIFERQANGKWLEVQKIVASDRRGADRFGQSCNILGNTIFIGAEENDYDVNVENVEDKAGAVFVFERDVNGIWKQTQKIVAHDRFQQSYFGCSVASYGDYMLIGARGDRHDVDGKNPITSCGSAYVYKKDQNNQWIFNRKLTPIIRRYFEQFGCDVAIHEKRIVIGAYRDAETSSYPDRGAAYIFELDLDEVWSPIQKITPTTRTGERFGWAVDVYQDVIVVGAYQHWAASSYVFSETGAAYAFEKDKSNGEWKQTTKFVKADPKQNDHFGYDVSMHRDLMVIGARRTNGSKGSVFMFKRNGVGNWEYVSYKESSHAEGGDYFGTSVQILNGKVIVGAPGEDHDLDEQNKLEASGSAFMFDDAVFATVSSLEKRHIQIHPNPCNGEFKLSLNDIRQNIILRITDIMGKVVYEQFIENDDRIKVNLNPGLYHVSLYQDQMFMGVSPLIIRNQ